MGVPPPPPRARILLYGALKFRAWLEFNLSQRRSKNETYKPRPIGRQSRSRRIFVSPIRIMTRVLELRTSAFIHPRKVNELVFFFSKEFRFRNNYGVGKSGVIFVLEYIVYAAPLRNYKRPFQLQQLIWCSRLQFVEAH